MERKEECDGEKGRIRGGKGKNEKEGRNELERRNEWEEEMGRMNERESKNKWERMDE